MTSNNEKGEQKNKREFNTIITNTSLASFETLEAFYYTRKYYKRCFIWSSSS